MQIEAKTIGDRLKKLRGDKPRDEVAKELGISYSALGMYEQGERIPRDEIKIKICDYYNVSIEDLFFSRKTTQLV
jgi:transcriptional regulator with XRE-family HTH domain